MRLIDADELIDKLVELRDKECGPKEKLNFKRKYKLTSISRARISADIKIIMNMPTAKRKRRGKYDNIR